MLGEFYRGKNVFITGCTGFVGKVVLEKMLYSLPQINRIYVLVRPKKGSSVEERFVREIIDSPCFDRLRKRHPDFSNYIAQKITPISGDMLKQDLALSPTDRDILQTNTNIIINCAASVDFNQRLDQALQINTLGSYRILELAIGCQYLDSHIQVSTAYVNSNRRGWIEEKLYPAAGDPEQLVNEIVRIPVEQIELKTPAILGAYPNTYTYTKFLTEHLLQKYKGHVPLVIVRPTIIGGSWLEPVPGWVDSMAAAGAFYLTAGLGILKAGIGGFDNICDQIPVDVVSNAILVAACIHAHSQNTPIIHVGTSDRNPVTMRKCRDTIVPYWRANPPEKKLGQCSFTMYKNKRVYSAIRFFQRKVPSYLYLQYAKLKQNPQTLKNARTLQKLLEREETIAVSFSHFTSYEWIYSSQEMQNMIKILPKSDKNEFIMDITLLNWNSYLPLYAYGLHRFVLGENVEPPQDPYGMDLISESRTGKYFSDIAWAYNSKSPVTSRSKKEMKQMVINSRRVQDTVNRLAEQQALTGKQQIEAAKAEQLQLASKFMDRLASNPKEPMIKVFGWTLRKIWRQTYDQLVVDQKAIKRIEKLKAKNDGPIVLVPSHRSYIDFLVLSYIMFTYKQTLPFIVSGEDFLNIMLVNHVLRMSGALFIRRKIGDDPLYTAILTEYVQQLLRDDQMLEFFIEGTRSRTGRMLPPKQGLLKMCTDAYYDGDVQNIHFLPVAISYDRVLEGETFPFELLGEQKVKESLGRIIKAVKILRQNFGKIYINFGSPVSLKEYSKSYLGLQPDINQLDRIRINNDLSFELINQIQDQLVVMPTAIVAAVLLMHRRGVSEEELTAKVDWLRQEILAKGYSVWSVTGSSATGMFRSAIMHISECIVYQKDLFEPRVSLDNNYKNILLVSYYRNTLLHIFAVEACCAVAIQSFGDKLAWEHGIQYSRVIEEVMFFCQVLKNEFVMRRQLDSLDLIEQTLEYMKTRKVLEIENGKVRITGGGNLHITFLCSLLWPMVDSYWATVLFAFSLKMRQTLPFRRTVRNIQQFAENMYTERLLNFYETCSQENIKNALNNLTQFGVLKIEYSTSDKQVSLSEQYINNETSLQELLDHIGKFRKASFVKSINVQDDIRRALMAEFPTTPKL